MSNFKKMVEAITSTRIKFLLQLKLIQYVFFCGLFSICFQITLSAENKPRPVFPLDIVKFSCNKTLDLNPTLKLASRDNCTWNFEIEGENSTEHGHLIESKMTNCIRTHNNVSRRGVETFVDYVEVPEGARSVWCVEGDNAVPTSLSLQNGRKAKPLSSFNSMTPQIILQRFSDDFALRFGVYEVTNENISVDADDLDSIKLFCVYNSEVIWTNYTIPMQRLFSHLKSIDIQLIESKYSKLVDAKLNLKNYFNFLLSEEQELVNSTKYSLEKAHVFVAPLIIRNVTNATSRKYECQGYHTRNNVESAVVTLTVENPRIIGPDEVQLIQQIIAILDSLAKGEDLGKSPWYTLVSFLIILLILFMYYSKKKLQQSADKNDEALKPPNNPPATQVDDAEQRSRLQSTTSSPPAQVMAIDNREEVGTTSSSLENVPLQEVVLRNP